MRDPLKEENESKQNARKIARRHRFHRRIEKLYVCSNGWSIGSVENEIRSLCHRDFDGPLERERERGADRRQSLARERSRLLEG